MTRTKTENKKLTLVRETLRTLTPDELRSVAGGAPVTSSAPCAAADAVSRVLSSNRCR